MNRQIISREDQLASFATTLDESGRSRRQGEAYLRLQLSDSLSAILPMQQTQEVLVVPSLRLTPMPNMPPPVIGLLNHRNRVVWVVDLPHLLDLPSLPMDMPQQTIAIVRVDQQPLALAVSQIRGVIRLMPDAIQSPVGTVPAALVPYLSGCCLLDSEMLLVLDPRAIIGADILAMRG
ncbi:chemotaxis protein CheW [Candidatus Synechococcus calcipolaris G9]|uniref:Chemotaxis protein CheW n=1 Tax=Candidatus Synechococcus calcipolaris G9 TaxID=1497997 RepID=A0ABT6F1Y7_9SYNE|nr:chemotaxis protein CheW [Candidatus Synechococcus calcipolaris]MDG2991875.1 chemotaxis protein CheW [Candidatus Synechococcus calcipolaris G9]